MALQLIVLLFIWCDFAIPVHSINTTVPVVDIVITVKTNFDILVPCVESLLRHAPDMEVLRQRIVLVDDGSSDTTLAYEKRLCENNPFTFVCLATESDSRGNTKAAVKGINFGAESNIISSVIVLLNSDTIVTSDWLLPLYNGLVLNSNKKVMIVGPLSNAASYQSVPLQLGLGGWNTNPLSPGMNIDQLARFVAKMGHDQETPQMILNGFCFMFKRELITAIGTLDAQRYPHGYGEEIDFSVRAAWAGYESRIVHSSYVYHSRISSLQVQERKALISASHKELLQSYGTKIFDDEHMKSLDQPSLVSMRKEVGQYYETVRKRYSEMNAPISILFYLSSVGMVGGVITIVTEACQMMLYGVRVTLAVPKSPKGKSIDNVRAMLPGISERDVQRLVLLYDNPSHFEKIASGYDMLVATYHATVTICEAVVKKNPTMVLGYYAQDYEPWFIVPLKSPQEVNHHALSNKVKGYYDVAINSYTANKKRIVIIAKTSWMVNMIEKNHGVKVSRVIGSLDHSVYYPDATLLARKLKKAYNGDSKFIIAAIIREGSTRRNPIMTLEVLLRLAHAYPEKVEITIIGSDSNYIHTLLTDLQRKLGPNDDSVPPHRSPHILKLKSIQFLPVQKRRGAMAEIFRRADIFMDLSWWQAFGRSGVGAMASGCVAVMPSIGASQEICENGKNCLSHDVDDIHGYIQKVVGIMKNDTARYDIIRNGIEKTWSFSLEGAAASIAKSLKVGYKRYHS